MSKLAVEAVIFDQRDFDAYWEYVATNAAHTGRDITNGSYFYLLSLAGCALVSADARAALELDRISNFWRISFPDLTDITDDEVLQRGRRDCEMPREEGMWL